MQRPFLIAGGGAPEAELSTQLQAWSHTLQGMTSYCVRAFGEALEVVPYTLAENAGLNPIQVRFEGGGAVGPARCVDADGPPRLSTPTRLLAKNAGPKSRFRPVLKMHPATRDPIHGRPTELHARGEENTHPPSFTRANTHAHMHPPTDTHTHTHQSAPTGRD